MSGKGQAKKKWTKEVNKEKREFSPILTAQQAEQMKKSLPCKQESTPYMYKRGIFL